mmetsp:Transcript_10966/g.29437  ORF Transcript_10966/g.29437 Transcript_10966/m.29437 type:complete len:217 (-) Transcript_10966:918-1568(-)
MRRLNLYLAHAKQRAQLRPSFSNLAHLAAAVAAAAAAATCLRWIEINLLGRTRRVLSLFLPIARFGAYHSSTWNALGWSRQCLCARAPFTSSVGSIPHFSIRMRSRSFMTACSATRLGRAASMLPYTTQPSTFSFPSVRLLAALLRGCRPSTCARSSSRIYATIAKLSRATWYSSPTPRLFHTAAPQHDTRTSADRNGNERRARFRAASLLSLQRP